MFAINYSLKINFLIKNKKAINSILPKIIKIINDIFVRLLKSTKLKPSNPYKDDVVVFVSVKIDNLKAVSKFKLSNVNMLDRINIEIINEIKTKKAILESSSVILVSELKRFLLKIFIGLAILCIS
tara:strand:+ start:402 stop:779 length:378 start_codon:yes stop_codon:yes gene_type:complete